MAQLSAEFGPVNEFNNETAEATVIQLATVAVTRAIQPASEPGLPDFGPKGIGRLPNTLDGYPNPEVKSFETHVDFSIYEPDNLPAYILAARPARQDIAC